jgi:hypothetical protein
MFLLHCLNHVYIFLCTRYKIMVNLSFTLLCSTCKSLTFKNIIFLSSFYFLLTHLKIRINVPHWIAHLNINKMHILTMWSFLDYILASTWWKIKPKPLSNCEGKITMRLFCQNAIVVELGFIENSLACFIFNPFILVDQHQVDIPCSKCLGTISQIKGVKFENQVCD